MEWWVWFLVGASIGVVQTAISMARTPTQAAGIFQNGHPIQGFLFAAFLGAAAYGTILWVVFGLLLDL